MMVRGLVLCVLVAVLCDAKRVKVFERGNRNKWPQAIIIAPDWNAFVTKTRHRLQLPANKYPTLKFYDSEDFEMQNVEEVDDGQYVFVDTSGEPVAPSLEGGALAHVPRSHFKTPGTKVHVWNYPGDENAESPVGTPGAESGGASPTASGGDKRAQLQAQIAALNQQMEQLAASRKYAEAAQAQAQVESLTAQLKSMVTEDPNAAKRAAIRGAMQKLEGQMDQAAANRKYAEAASLQQQHDQLKAQLDAL